MSDYFPKYYPFALRRIVEDLPLLGATSSVPNGLLANTYERDQALRHARHTAARMLSRAMEDHILKNDLVIEKHERTNVTYETDVYVLTRHQLLEALNAAHSAGHSQARDALVSFEATKP